MRGSEDVASEPPARKLVSGDITTYPISFMRWRACMALIVLQVRTRDTRVLCYFDTKRKHTGSWVTVCSGASCERCARCSSSCRGARSTTSRKRGEQIRRQLDSLNAQLSAIDAKLRLATASEDVRMLKGVKALICKEQPCQELHPDRAKALFGVL